LVPLATVYELSHRALGHTHNTGVADLVLPREIHDEFSPTDGRSHTGLDSRVS